MDVKQRIQELEEHKGSQPAQTIQRACQAIEIVLRDLLKLPNGTRLAALQEEFRNRYPEEVHLHHKITTLRKLRNAIVHEDREPWPGDEEIALGTLKNFAYFTEEKGLVELGASYRLLTPKLITYVDAQSVAPAEPLEPLSRLDWKNFEKLVEAHFEDLLGLQFRSQAGEVLTDGSKHVFDLASLDGQIVIECKSHTWTKSGNYPSAKVTDSKITAECLKKHPAKRKLLVFQDDFWERKSLAETFMRRNILALKGIEIWAYSHGEFKRLDGEKSR